jgi:integrase/recombinase XerD
MAKDLEPRNRFQDTLERWLATYPSENTRAAYRGDLTAFATWCSANRRSPLKVEPSDLALYRRRSALDGATSTTVARRASAVSSFYKFAAAAGFANPLAASVDRQGRVGSSPTVALTDDEVGDLIDTLETRPERERLLVSLMLFDGLKLGESLQLDVGDITGRAPNLVAQVQRIAGPQPVQLDTRTATVLSQIVRRRRSGPLLLGESPSDDGKTRLTRFGAGYLVKRIGRAAGLQNPLTTNALRRTYVRRAMAGGAMPDDVRSHLGQRDVRTTERYLTDTTSPETTMVGGHGSSRRPRQRR